MQRSCAQLYRPISARAIAQAVRSGERRTTRLKCPEAFGRRPDDPWDPVILGAQTITVTAGEYLFYPSPSALTALAQAPGQSELPLVPCCAVTAWRRSSRATSQPTPTKRRYHGPAMADQCRCWGSNPGPED
jgi:hypothetical protein